MSSTDFVITPNDGLGTESRSPEFSADGGGTWHRNLTDCAFSAVQNLKVTFTQVSHANSDASAAVQVLESAVKVDQIRNSVELKLDYIQIDMSLAGTWSVEITDMQLQRGPLLAFEMIIVAGCKRYGPTSQTTRFPALIWPLDQFSELTITDTASWKPSLSTFS